MNSENRKIGISEDYSGASTVSHPIRSCVCCGNKQIKWTLNRFVLDEKGSVIKDPKMNKTGRGAYVCDDPSCWNKLSKDDRLRKALKAKEL